MLSILLLIRISLLPPNCISVPLPAILVAIVTELGIPAAAIIFASSA